MLKVRLQNFTIFFLLKKFYKFDLFFRWIQLKDFNFFLYLFYAAFYIYQRPYKLNKLEIKNIYSKYKILILIFWYYYMAKNIFFPINMKSFWRNNNFLKIIKEINLQYQKLNNERKNKDYINLEKTNFIFYN